jgi:hypothetical protein
MKYPHLFSSKSILKNMKTLFNLLLTMVVSISGVFAQNNDFYDDAETFPLEGQHIIDVRGELINGGKVDITKFQKHSIIVKEAILEADTTRFVGAYRYDGYSLSDILNDFIVKKNNQAVFSQVIDLYVTIENDRGDTVVLSWGEIYYPVHLHDILIATSVARIVPSKTKDLWPLPEQTRLVIGHDLISQRNIPNPTRITIRSAAIDLPVKKDAGVLFSPQIKVLIDKRQAGSVASLNKTLPWLTYNSIFYGRGRGIHGTTAFTGLPLKQVLTNFVKVNSAELRKGYLIIAAPDGYRGVFSFSEIFNRNDQAEALLIEDRENKDGGAFRLFPASDFFSDRAIKAVSEIYYRMIK